MIQATEFFIPGFCGMGLHFQMDGFRLIYVGIAVLMWAVSGVFSLEYMAHYEKRRRYYVFFWATFLATVGVFLSADFYTTFIFFEIMSFTSYVWVVFDERTESKKAAETYLAVAVIGGMVMLMGLFILYDMLGILRFGEIKEAAEQMLLADVSGAGKRRLYVAAGLLLFGFGAKAGCFPLHIWLPKAHPQAPAPASALLSGILTKAGIFGIVVISCILFWNDQRWGMLIALLGLITMFIGAMLALFSINLKRTLACSSISQIGFILTGIGMSCLLQAAGEDRGLAVRGAFLHMINHSLFKLVLFLCAAAVYMNLHQLDLNEIRGFGKRKPLLMFCFLMGALGIGGMPLWSGYVSKTLLHESIVEYGKAAAEISKAGVWEAGAGFMDGRGFGILVSPGFWHGAEWVFLVSGGMTVAYMMKLFVALFVDSHPTRQKEFDAMGGNGLGKNFHGMKKKEDWKNWSGKESYMKLSSGLALTIAAVLLPLFGVMPHKIMDVLAQMGQGFFGYTGYSHEVHYFSFENLKGGLISISIGILLYGVVVRRWMMGAEAWEREVFQSGGVTQGGQRNKKASREKRYLDRWPEWLDLENLFYRPVLQTVVPGVCGAVCDFVDRYVVSVPTTVFLAVSSVICRGMDQMADGVVRAGRETTHSQIPRAEEKRKKPMFGGFFESGKKVVCQMADRILRNGRLVEESFSFGLMLFAFGLCLTLGYLLFVFLMR